MRHLSVNTPHTKTPVGRSCVLTIANKRDPFLRVSCILQQQTLFLVDLKLAFRAPKVRSISAWGVAR
jgi:hypothetical protein